MLERELGEPAHIQRDRVTVGKVSVPLRTDGTFTFDLSEPGTPPFSLVDVLPHRVPPASFSNHIVLVFAKTPDAPKFRIGYPQPHNAAELVADTINTVLKRL